MRFTQCIATKTGVLENRIINFGDDITVICGPNESGKTLTMKAMTDSLLGYGAENRILDDETWKNLQINLTVEDASSRLKIIRTGTSHLAVTDFSDGTGRELFIGEIKNGRIPEPLKTVKSEIFGIISRFTPAVFSDSSYAVSPFDSYLKPYSDFLSIRKIIFYQESGFLGIRDKLGRALCGQNESEKIGSSLQSGIAFHENEIRKIDKECMIFDIHSSKIGKLSGEKKEIEKINQGILLEKAELQSNMEFLHKSHEALASVFIIESKLNGLKNFVSSEEIKTANIKLRKKDASARFSKFISLSESQRNNLNNIQMAYKSAIDAKDSFSKRIKTLGLIKTFFFTSVSIFTFFSLSFPLLLHGITDDILTLPSYLKAIVPACGLIIAALAVFMFKKSLKKDSSVHLDRIFKQRITELEEILSKSEIPLVSAHFEDMFEFLLQYFEEYSEFLECESETEEIENTLLPAEKVESVKTEIAELQTNKTDLLKMLDGINGENNSKNSAINKMIEENEKRAAELDSELKRNAEMIQRIEEELEAAVTGSTATEALTAQKSFHSTKLNSLRNSEKSASYILMAMEKAGYNFEMKTITEAIDETFDIFTKISSSEAVSYNDISELIKGNIEAVKNTPLRYNALLSFKIAAGSIMKKSGISLPLIIDDPASYMDKGKIDVLSGILKEHPAGRQIIILTSDENLFSGLGQTVKF